MIVNKKSMGILTFIVLLGSVGAVFGVPHLRFWAWASDVKLVAGVSYTSLLSIKLDRLGIAEDRLERCLVDQRTDKNMNCTRQRNDVNRLKQEITDINNDKKNFGN